MVMFDLAYRHGFFGCCSVYLAKARPSETVGALEWIRYISLTTMENIINELLSSKVPESLLDFFLATEVSDENADCVAQAFIALGCLFSDCNPAILKFADGPYCEKVLDRATKWAHQGRACKGFMQFMSALTTSRYRPLKAFIKSKHLDMALEVLNKRDDEDISNLIVDCLCLFEFLTDARDGEDERAYSSVILYLFDRKVYEICLEGLADDKIDIRLRVLCARCIGNGLSLSENFNNVENVISCKEENYEYTECTEHMQQRPDQKPSPHLDTGNCLADGEHGSHQRPRYRLPAITKQRPYGVFNHDVDRKLQPEGSPG